MDNGSSMCRIGLSGDDMPKFFFPNVIGRPKFENMIISTNEKIYIGP